MVEDTETTDKGTIIDQINFHLEGYVFDSISIADDAKGIDISFSSANFPHNNDEAPDPPTFQRLIRVLNASADDLQIII